VIVLYALGGLLAGFGAIQNVTRSAIVPNLVAPEKLRSALALNFGLFQLTLVLGPGARRPADRRRRVEGAYFADAGLVPGDGRAPRADGRRSRRTSRTASSPRRSARRSPRACASCAASRR